MKWIYFFREGSKDMRSILGGKGANLAEMKGIGLPVPEGFTIITKACLEYIKWDKWPTEVKSQIHTSMGRLERKTGKKFGSPRNPLLVSVRSGAPVSMPGMMDTILNLGLNDEVVEGLAKLTNNQRFAYDAYRRLIQMFGDVVLGVPHLEFEEILSSYKRHTGAKYDYELDTSTLVEIISAYKKLIKRYYKPGFPQDPWKQLDMAVEAVWRSWNNPRAVVYRKANNIPDNIGTAVNIVEMVFGNIGDDSGTGVLFTRNPSTGEHKLYGEFLINAQGEDVVAGIRTPQDIGQLRRYMPKVARQLEKIAKKLEKHYRDMQDIEFTVEKGKLYILQTRTGKRTPNASVKIAVDMVKEGLITKEEAIMRVDPEALTKLLHPRIDYSSNPVVIARGLPASPGAAVGKVIFNSDEAKELGDSGEAVILVRPETTPDDIHGVIAARGVLTSRGGMTSHAAVIARGMGKPAVVGCGGIIIDMENERFVVGERLIKKGDIITIDGSTGNVILGEVKVLPPGVSKDMNILLKWADEFKRLKVKANADLPKDAKIAREFGAQGIGLCRTEHMFLGPDRLPIVQEMILATDELKKKKQLRKLLKRQVKDFVKLLEVADGLPVTIRLLDPPLHEFLPDITDLKVKLVELKLTHGDPLEIKRIEKLVSKVKQLREANPMLGHRGCRLGITMPELYRMQVRAIAKATVKLKKGGMHPRPEIEIPLVAFVEEVDYLKKEILDELSEVSKEDGVKLSIPIGSMVELPRAAIISSKLSERLDFMSFGTNDLTQTTLGFSRDDAGKFIPEYIKKGILNFDPFQVIDEEGVGFLMKQCLVNAKHVNPKIEIGICGEQGGEPRSVDFCHRIGLDYVSCSPYRIPVARLAAAQAAIREKSKKRKTKGGHKTHSVKPRRVRKKRR